MISVTCENCSKEFFKNKSEAARSPRHFCSRSCANSKHNTEKAKRSKKQRTCTLCTKSYIQTKARRKICEVCFVPPLCKDNMTLSQCKDKLSVQGKHPSWYTVHVRGHNRTKNKKLATSCQKCGYSKHVECCHIKPVASFEGNATLAEINHVDNIVVLCRNCHWEFDHNQLSIVDIPKRK